LQKTFFKHHASIDRPTTSLKHMHIDRCCLPHTLKILMRTPVSRLPPSKI